MAKQQEDVKKRTVLVPVDGSEHSERAFDCEYWRLSWLAVHNWPIRLRYSHFFRTIDPFPVKSQLIFPLSTHEALKLSAQMFKAFSLYLTGSTQKKKQQQWFPIFHTRRRFDGGKLDCSILLQREYFLDQININWIIISLL